MTSSSSLYRFDIEVANKYPENEDHKVINTPEWREIQNLASNTHKKITRSLKERNYDCEQCTDL